MAITTLAGAIAGQQPRDFFIKSLISTQVNHMKSMWGPLGGGYPASGSYDTTLNGVTLSSTSAQVTGQMRFFDPASGNAHLAQLKAISSGQWVSGQVIVADRLWHNGGYTITSTAAQNSTTPTWPARDINGSTNGDGVLLGVEVSAVTGAGTPTITISYTNSDGTAGRSGTNIYATLASMNAGVFIPIGLQAGDTGVRSVQSLTLSATWTSGTINLVAYRLIASSPISVISQNSGDEALTLGLPRVYNGSVPFILLHQQVAGSGNVTGHYRFTNG